MPADLAGKWCYLNPTVNSLSGITTSCIILRTDGSYEISLDLALVPQANRFPGTQQTDYGTWWVQGDRLNYDSPAHGQGSFGLRRANHPTIENLPLIILDGVSFGSDSGHDPW
ncbi:MAG: hypothetical protein K1X47_16765 [Cyclobacteriaceae bacterium]|nr:hypothetical protein [Cyclobacteriaceae bacterium]